MSLELSGSKVIILVKRCLAVHLMFLIFQYMRTLLWGLAISVALTMQIPEGNAFLAAHVNSISCVLIAIGDWYIWCQQS